MPDHNITKYNDQLETSDYNKLKNVTLEIEKNIDKDHILEQHFYYLGKIRAFYAFRDKEEDALDETIEACKQQIAMADKALQGFIDDHNNRITEMKEMDAELGIDSGFAEEDAGDPVIPSHTGYQQLATIYRKQKKYKEAIEMCEQALKQGWVGDWEKRIEKDSKKL